MVAVSVRFCVRSHLLEAVKCSKPVVSKKEPISADIIKQIIVKYAGPSANLKYLRLACMC